MVKEKKPRPIIEPEFARRLEYACDNMGETVPPYNYGRLPWFVKQFKAKNITVSRESVRKWMAGEARPRPDKVRLLADILKVDVSWLEHGSSGGDTPAQKRRKSVIADSTVNLVAGMFGMSGATYAFPEDEGEDSGAHFYAIMRGRQNTIHVALGEPTKTGFQFSVTPKFDSLLVIGLVKRSPVHFDLYQMPSSVLAKYGKRMGNAVEVVATASDDELTVQGATLPLIEDFDSLRRVPVEA